MDCIFCNIAKGEVPVPFLYEDDEVVIFKDREPRAPVHFLVIPKQHIASLLELETSHKDTIGHMFHAANKVATEQLGLEGYKAVINAGEVGGQEVFHLHLHIMGGTSLSMPKPL